MCPGTDLNRYDRCGSQDFKSCVSTNFTTRAPKKIHPSGWIFWAEDRARTGHPDLGKVVLYQMSYFRFLKNFCFGVAKIRRSYNCYQIFFKIIYTLVCTVYSQAQYFLLAQIFPYKVLHMYLIRKPKDRIKTGKKEKQMKKPSCV